MRRTLILFLPMALLFAPVGEAQQGNPIVALTPNSAEKSYSASTTVTAAASPTDIAGLPGNATNTVYVTSVTVSCTKTTAGILTITLLRRSTADTLGTSTNTTITPDDPNYAAAVSVPLTYTANPTLGTLVGKVDEQQIGAMTTATATSNDIYIWPPPAAGSPKPVVLRGTAQVLYVNFGGVALAGLQCSVTYRWLEK